MYISDGCSDVKVLALQQYYIDYETGEGEWRDVPIE